MFLAFVLLAFLHVLTASLYIHRLLATIALKDEDINNLHYSLLKAERPEVARVVHTHDKPDKTEDQIAREKELLKQQASLWGR